ncbi:MAG TPA: long-chain fatty acid--CoA ligase [Pyrinomonadaceae bacterium]
MIYAHSLRRGLRYYPEKTAFATGDKRVSFSELHDRVGGIATALSKHGFKAGDRLALLLPNETEFIELIYACAWLGLVVVPLNTRLSTTEINHILIDAAPHGLIHHSSLPLPTVQLPWQLVLDKEPLSVSTETYPDPVYDPDAVFALIYTSGTTGLPKGVALTHANIMANLDHVNYWMRYREGGVYLHAAPIFHIADFPFMFASPAFGSCQTTIPKFSPQLFCEAVQRERVTHTVLVPTMINLLLQFEDLKEYDLSSLERLGYGGSPVAPELIHRIREVFPNIELVQVYGLSETGFLTGLQDHEHTEDRLTSCGRACPGIDLQVVDETGKDVEVGKPGELVVRGLNVMRGYWNSPKISASAFREGMFRTGDIGYQDAEGYVYILDRLKDMIVSGGENVYSAEVEAVIYKHPAVREAAVFGIPDPNWGELVTAMVVLKPGATLTAEELISFCRLSLAHYKIPRHIEFSFEELPKSGSGKILKKVLREKFWIREERSVA